VGTILLRMEKNVMMVTQINMMDVHRDVDLNDTHPYIMTIISEPTNTHVLLKWLICSPQVILHQSQ